ncbi:helix-turn-helix transcriptional regulator [Inquilinus sp. NPDC058860]|uniref:helix-turn-helix transcriptional regulator n=1 Tax=Inquilinus sp. NPDC058860 TaxID=3346652 RepID=UPI0036AD14C8
MPLQTSKSRAGASDTGPGKRVRVCDFLRRKGITLDSPDDSISPEDTLIAGDLLNQELRHGLFLHGGNVVEEHAFTATSHLPEGLSCIFFLDGEVAVRIGGRRFEFRGDRRGTIAAAAVMSVTPESFLRMSTGRQHVHHLVVSATPEWLNVDGLEEVRGDRLATRLFRDHLADHRWTPTPRVSELVRGIFAPSGFGPELNALYLEGRAVAIVAETIAAVMHADRGAEPGGLLMARERIRLQRAKDLIAADPSRPLRVETIAREAGVSASGLQRLFRLSEGCSVFEFVRLARLGRARAALQSGEASVQDASAIAGYSSPANFATAFKRRYGVTPREASRQP